MLAPWLQNNIHANVNASARADSDADADADADANAVPNSIPPNQKNAAQSHIICESCFVAKSENPLIGSVQRPAASHQPLPLIPPSLMI